MREEKRTVKPRFFKFLPGLLFGYGLAILLLNAAEAIRPWLMIGLAVLNFMLAIVYVRLTRRNRVERRYAAQIFTVFGLLSLMLAVSLWITPIPPPDLETSLALLGGGLLGSVVVWFWRKREA
jgi:tellurite resistance protein TehA-like permease